MFKRGFQPKVGNPYIKAWLFKSFEFGNESKMYDEKLIILEFKYLQKKMVETRCKKYSNKK